ncbi:MAG: hypothetical protein Q9178_003288 [Gyalolechia marmorata]
MPKARAVTSLILRRQTRHPWKPEALEELLDLLPEVHEIHYEPWRDWRRMEERPTNTTTMRLCKSLRFDQLRRMVIFENFHGNNPGMSLPVQAARIHIAYALVEASLGLEHLAASFISDASHFFDACQKWSIWPRLESLALTSNALKSQQQSSYINDLLETTAVVAMKMPRLKLMELWNGRAGFAGVFQYQIVESDCTAKITWRSTCDLSLEPRTLKAWQAVASERVGCKLQVFTEILDANVVITSHGDAIRHLMLLTTVVHPVSLWQIQKETAYRSRSR